MTNNLPIATKIQLTDADDQINMFTIRITDGN